MFLKNNGVKRVISVTAAALCLISSLRIAPLKISDADAANTMTAFQITENMQLGWNLGNTFDAYAQDINGNAYETSGLEAETCWGNPKTTTQMLDAVKAKGFNTIRIPVTWFQHVDKNNNYKIDDAWMARVKEVVDYCYNKGFYIILNMHHEEGWANRSDLGSAYNQIKPFFTSVWSQIATTFADYDQHLVFEAMNEPRAKGTDYEWWSPTTPQAECDVINKLNADIVNVIRSTSSPYQYTRLIMLPSYCAGSDPTFMSANKIPEGDDYLAASVHAYTPYDFTMNDEVKDHSQFTSKYKSDLKWCLDAVKETFIDKNIPVVIGEFSSSNYGNQNARIEWADTYMTTTKGYGIPCVLWDNNVEKNNGGESHGYLNRNSCTWYSDSEPVINKMLQVLADDSIKWGGKSGSVAPPAGVEHEDLSSGTKLFEGSTDLDASKSSEADGYKNSMGIDIKWSQLDGKDIAVVYEGATAPAVAVSDSSWNGWTEVNAYDSKDGVAYYSMAQLGEKWGDDKNSIAHFSVRTNDLTTVKQIIAIKGADAGDLPVDKTKKYPLDLSARNNYTSASALTVTFSGTPGAVIEGCVGYMGSEWTTISFKQKIGSDGKFTAQYVLATNGESGDNVIPAGVNSAEAQIWYCEDENAEMTGYTVIGFGGGVVSSSTETTTTTTTTTSSTTTSTTTESTTSTTSTSVPVNKTAGDSNCDGQVNLADAVYIMQYIANQNKYPLSAQGAVNADVVDNDGVTNKDALEIQRFCLGLVSKLN